MFLFYQISCEERHSVEAAGGSELQYDNGTYSTYHGLETEKMAAEFSSETYTNNTSNWMTGGYNGTYVNHTGTWRTGVSEAVKGKHLVGSSKATHQGTYRNQRWSWRGRNCSRTCANSTTNWGRVICNGTCANRTCGWRAGCSNSTWNWRTGDCSRIFRILMYHTWNWRPEEYKAAFVNRTRARVSNETYHRTYRSHMALKY